MTKYLSLPGSSGHYVSTPDAAALDATGDLDLRVKGAMDDWTPASAQALIAKFLSAGDQRSYELRLLASGALRLLVSTDGTLGNLFTFTSSVATGVTDGEVKWVRSAIDIDNGAGDADCTFYTSDDGSSWTQLGTVQNLGFGLGAIHAGTADLVVGATENGGAAHAAGDFFEAQVLDGIDGTLVADFNADDFLVGNSDSDTAEDSTGKTWTINGANSEILGGSNLLLLGVG